MQVCVFIYIRDGADPIQYRYRGRYQRNSRIGFSRSNLRRYPISMSHVCALTLSAEMTPKVIPAGESASWLQTAEWIS